MCGKCGLRLGAPVGGNHGMGLFDAMDSLKPGSRASVNVDPHDASFRYDWRGLHESGTKEHPIAQLFAKNGWTFVPAHAYSLTFRFERKNQKVIVNVVIPYEHTEVQSISVLDANPMPNLIDVMDNVAAEPRKGGIKVDPNDYSYTFKWEGLINNGNADRIAKICATQGWKFLRHSNVDGFTYYHFENNKSKEVVKVASFMENTRGKEIWVFPVIKRQSSVTQTT
jgi:hypothetical protein